MAAQQIFFFVIWLAGEWSFFKSQFVYDFWQTVANYLFACASFSLSIKWVIGRTSESLAARAERKRGSYVLCGQALFDARMKVIRPSHIKSQAVLLTFLVSEPIPIGHSSISRLATTYCAADVAEMKIPAGYKVSGPLPSKSFPFSAFFEACRMISRPLTENWNFLSNLRTAMGSNIKNNDYPKFHLRS